MSILVLPTASLAYAGMPDDLAERKTRDAAMAADEVRSATGIPVTVAPLIRDAASAAAAAELADSPDLDVIVVLPTMAAMAGYAWSAIETSTAPLVVWNRWAAHAPEDDPRSLVLHSGPVGVAAITNVLVRAGRQFELFFGEPSDSFVEFLVAARAARHLTRSGVGRIGGPPWPEMLDVTIDPEHLRQVTGIPVHELALTTGIDRDGLAPDDRSGVPVVGGNVSRSAALAAAVLDACAGSGVVAGAINCHGAQIMGSADFGVAGCWAACLAQRQGVPIACTADLCTAVALYAAYALSGSAQYVEVDAIDPRVGASLVSNGGEADLTMLREDPAPRLVGNQFFSGAAGAGLAFDAVLAPGAVTALAFSPVGDGYRLIAAEGRILRDEPPAAPVTRGYLQLQGDHVAALRRWWSAGANHHAAIAKGHIGDSAAVFSRLLNMEFTRC